MSICMHGGMHASTNAHSSCPAPPPPPHLGASREHSDCLVHKHGPRRGIPLPYWCASRASACCTGRGGGREGGGEAGERRERERGRHLEGQCSHGGSFAGTERNKDRCLSNARAKLSLGEGILAPIRHHLHTHARTHAHTHTHTHTQSEAETETETETETAIQRQRQRDRDRDREKESKSKSKRALVFTCCPNCSWTARSTSSCERSRTEQSCGRGLSQLSVLAVDSE